MSLGTTLDPAHRARLNRLALDFTYHGLLGGRLDYLHAGLFPSHDRNEAAVSVKWGTRRVPFTEIRRVYEWDVESIWRAGAGRLFAVLEGYATVEDPPDRAVKPATIDEELARRMPRATLPIAADVNTVSEPVSRPLTRLVLRGRVLGALCTGVEVPPAPIRRNLETEPRLIGPDGVVRWNKASLLSDADLTALATEFADRAYTLLLGVAEGRIGVPARAPGEWPPEEFDPGLLPV